MKISIILFLIIRVLLYCKYSKIRNIIVKHKQIKNNPNREYNIIII